jgi:hypothetical protein
MIQKMSDPLDYIATPTAAKFHNDTSLIRALLGPVGCGKSVACCMEIFRIMCSQEVGKDGYRRTKAVCIRNTYPELVTTTLKTWKMLFPTPETGRIVHGSPTIHYFELGNIRAEVIFMSLGSEDDIKKLKSLECTVVWINECQYLFREAITVALERAMRYPPKTHSSTTQYGVILDTNPPDTNHWFFKLFEETKPANHKIFHYPPALIKTDGLWIPNPKAENIENLELGYDYYLNQLPGQKDEYIKVMFCGEYGSSYNGRPVYPEYNDALHYSPSLKADPKLPLYLGFDFGLTPALLIAQFHNGQLRIIDELNTDYMGLSNFVKSMVTPLFSQYYSNYKIEMSVGDPSGNAGNPSDERITCFTILQNHGFATIPAKTNNFLTRKESVSRRLSNLADGEPAFVIGPKCQSLRKGMLGGYHYKALNTLSFGETKYSPEVDKNQYSHGQDCAQYIALIFDNFKTEKAATKESRNQMMRKLGII